MISTQGRSYGATICEISERHLIWPPIIWLMLLIPLSVACTAYASGATQQTTKHPVSDELVPVTFTSAKAAPTSESVNHNKREAMALPTRTPAGPIPTANLVTTPITLLPSPTPTPPPPLPAYVLIENVSRQGQSRNLSCESRAASSLAEYYGLQIPEMTFFEALPKSDNPEQGFVGSVDAPPGSLPPLGYGVYARPVAEALQDFGLCAEAHKHFGLERLKASLAANHPVIVWATYDLRESPRHDYVAADGSPAYAIPYQHVFLAVGYDETHVHLIDVWNGALKVFPLASFAAAWERFEQMAVTTCVENLRLANLTSDKSQP